MGGGRPESQICVNIDKESLYTVTRRVLIVLDETFDPERDILAEMMEGYGELEYEVCCPRGDSDSKSGEYLTCKIKLNTGIREVFLIWELFESLRPIIPNRYTKI